MGETIYVTPPDLHLPVDRLRFYFLGGSAQWRQQAQGLIDEVYSSASVTHYFTPEPLEDKNVPWVVANIHHVDLIIVNIDVINNLELIFAASLCKQENVWFYNGEGKNKSIQKILNTIGRTAIIRDMPTFKVALDMEAKHG